MLKHYPLLICSSETFIMQAAFVSILGVVFAYKFQNHKKEGGGQYKAMTG